MTRDDLLKQINESGVTLAKTALAMPGMFPQGCALNDAIRNYQTAVERLTAARKAWAALIAPAADWAPSDPFAEELAAIDREQSQQTGDRNG